MSLYMLNHHPLSLFQDLLEEGMTTHSSIALWRIQWPEEPGRLQSIVSQDLDMTEATENTHTLVVEA